MRAQEPTRCRPVVRPRRETAARLSIAVRSAISFVLSLGLGQTSFVSSADAVVFEPPSPPPTFAPHVGGVWGPVLEWPHVPVSMANLPDGRILTYASNEPNWFPISTDDEFTHAAVWDPSDGSIRSVPHPNHDMFCAAMVMLESGETFVMGGRNKADSPWVSFYDFHLDRWVQFDASRQMNRGRWYPTALTLGNGDVFVAVGQGGGPFPERWTEGEGFTLLSGIDLSNTMLSLGTIDGAGAWPLLQLAPDGSVFHHGATLTMNRIDPFGGSGGLGTISDLGPHAYGWFPDEGVSVTYDAGKILVAGGSTSATDSTAVRNAYTIDINGPGPVLTPAAQMHYPRQFMNEVLLPTGDVLVVGGDSSGFKFRDEHALRNAEVWNPATDSWTLLNPQDQARTYHSTALLLVDGTVLSGGGGMRGDPCDGLAAPGECGVDHWNAEVFSPPYLFAADDTLATRPSIDVAPGVVRVGRTFSVQATPGLSAFSLIRMSSTTHTMNTDQRFLRPAFVETSAGSYDLTLPANENILVPGYWMLFALDGQVPSVAKVMQIVNDGTPRGPPIPGINNDVGDTVLFQVEVEDPDGNPIDFTAIGLPDGLTIGPTTGVIQGTLTTAGIYNVSILALDGTDAVNIDFQWVVSSERSEFGTLMPVDETWQLVTLENVYTNPVVVMGPASLLDADPLAVRVRNVTGTSFEFRLEEWPAQDGLHAGETISYLVVEAGEYRVPGGGVLIAGVAAGIDYQNPRAVDFPATSFTTPPTVLAQVATTLGQPVAPPATARVDGVSSAGFSLRIQEEEAGNQVFPAEDVHWVALEPAAVSGLLETQLGASAVDESAAAVSFGQGFSATPHLFAGLQTSGDLDPVTLRYQNASAAGFEVVAQEETSADAEVDHAGEGFGWLAIDPAAETLALLPLFNQAPTVVAPADLTNFRDESVSLFIEAVDPEGSALDFDATGLPPGLTVDPATGEISGTLTLAGAWVVTLTATDSSGDSGEATFLWTVEDPLELVAFPTPPQINGALVEYTAVTNVAGSFEYDWEFGDGSAPSGPSTSPDVVHVFPGPGRYVVTLSAFDPATANTDVLQFVQIVTSPTTTLAPTATSSIAHDATSDRVWVANPDNDSVSVIDGATNTRLAEIPVSAGPQTVAIGADGRVWVACQAGSTIDILDPVSLAVVQSVPFHSGAGPFGVVFDPTGTTAFVSLEDAEEVLRLDGSTGAVLATANVVGRVRHLSVSADGGTLFASRFVTAPLPGEATGVPQTEVGGNPVGAELLRFDATSLASGTTIVLQADLVSDSEQSARGVPNYLGAPVISPDGSHLLVPSKQDNIFRGGFRDGLPLTHDSTVRAILSRVDLATGLEDFPARLDHDNASVASATAFTPLGGYALTALEGNRQVAIVDPVSHFELGRIDVGRSPRGLVVSADGTRLFVDNFMDRSVWVFDLSSLIGFNDSELPLVATVDKVVNEALSPDVLLGKQLFHDAADSRLSLQSYLFCAACHSDASEDGRTWDFSDLGEGLRNTISLRGHGVGQGRLHWTANFDEFQDFELQIRHFGGEGLLSEADFASVQDPLGPPAAGLDPDLDALAAYLASLDDDGDSPDRAGDGSLTAEAQAGRAIFEAEGCGGCHGGVEFSDSEAGQLHDVGTLHAGSGAATALDTPTLRGLWRTAPYLHSGAAPDLVSAVTAHAGASLDAQELASLEAYLRQIDDAESAAPNAEPTLDLTSPVEGTSHTAGVVVDLVATASDSEDGDLTSVVEWSSDPDGVIGSGGSLGVTTLSVGVHTITAAVTDSGGRTASAARSITIVENEAPTVSITTPADGSFFFETAPISFAATATDPEDGDLTEQLVWTSDLDGEIGTGASFSRNDLSVGTHVITAFVTDSLGLPDSHVLMLTVATNVPASIDITSPLDGSTATVGAAVTLVATASDPEDGDLTPSIAWSSSLDGALGIGGTLGLSTLRVGVHVLTASVVDSFGASSSANVTLTLAENTAPSVAITAPVDGASEAQGASVALMANASDPEEGDLGAAISWSSDLDGALGSGPALVVTTLSPGTHVLTASVVDSLGLQASAQVGLTITPNAAPSVTLSSPANGSSVTEGTTLDLMASASDPEEGDLTAGLVWESDRDGTLGTGGSVSTNALSLGLHLLTAKVSDSVGREGSASAQVTILANQAPTIELLSPGDGTSVTFGAQVDLTASATDPEDGDLTAALVWTSSLDAALGTGGLISTSSLSLGTHVITVSVADGLGLESQAQLSLTVAANETPVVEITSPIDGATATAGTVVDLVATANDPEDGDLSASISWSSDLAGPIGTGASLQTSALGIGTHLLSASATDTLSLTGSDQITLTIAANEAPLVTIVSPADGGSALRGAPITLTATAVDPEEGDLSAAIAWTSSLDGVLGTGSSLQTTSLSAGTHLLTATVADSLALAGEAQLSFTITPNGAPIVNITAPLDGGSQSEALPLDLVATASDPEAGDLSASIDWLSSLDGSLGVGASLTTDSLSVGIHSLTAMAVDGEGNSGSAQISFEILANDAPLVTIETPLDQAELTQGVPTTFGATASDTEDGDLAASLVWTSDVDGPLGTGGSLMLDDLSLGAHVISAGVTDSLGRSTEAQIGVSVAVNAPPAVSITAPLDGTNEFENVAIAFVATADDPEDGDLSAAIEWSSDLDGVLASGGTPTLSSLSVGVHAITATAIDALGLAGQAQITLTIFANTAPTLDVVSPQPGATSLAGAPLSLSATASDLEEGDLSAAISWSSDLDGALGSGGELTLTSLSVGSHTITAAVTDGGDLSAEVQRAVTIEPNTTPSIAITAPLDGTSVFETAPVDLIANASDVEDGDLTATIVWSSNLDGALGTGGNLQLTTLSVGSHVLTATVTDQQGQEANDQVGLTVQGNGVPTVTISSPADGSTATAGTSVDFMASANDPEDGDLTASIAWSSSLDGPLGGGGTFTTSTLGLGSHVVTASVVDSLGAQGEAQLTIVIEANAAPTLSITTPADGVTSIAGTSLAFSALADDPEDGDLRPAVQWQSDLDGPLGSGGDLATAALSIGVHTITASVSDSLGLAANASIGVTITPNSEPTVSITAPADGATVTEGANLGLAATADDSEEGDLSGAIAWSSDRDGPLGVGGSLAITTLSLGAHVITASVADSLGLMATATIGLTVAPNLAPDVTITSPTAGASFVEGVAVDMMATANDPEDGDVSNALAWTSDRDGPLGGGATLQLSTLSIGSHLLTATAQDSLGLAGSAQVSVTVVANNPPELNLWNPADGGSAPEGTSVFLSATATDVEDGNLSASIEWSSSLDGMLGLGSILNPDDLSPGTHLIVASVTDSLGLSDSGQVSFTILANQAPTLTVQSPVDQSNVTLGDSITLAAVANDPEDGDLSASIVWASSVDGALGTGASIVIQPQTLGVHVFTAFVADSRGLPDAMQVSVTIVPNQPPVVEIVDPDGPRDIPPGAPLSLGATATDPEDGNIAALAVWTSSLDGVLGTGEGLVVDDLSEGLHGISVQVTDAHGASASDQVIVRVPEPGLTALLGWGAALLARLARRRRVARSSS